MDICFETSISPLTYLLQIHPHLETCSRNSFHIQIFRSNRDNPHKIPHTLPCGQSIWGFYSNYHSLTEISFQLKSFASHLYSQKYFPGKWKPWSCGNFSAKLESSPPIRNLKHKSCVHDISQEMPSNWGFAPIIRAFLGKYHSLTEKSPLTCTCTFSSKMSRAHAHALLVVSNFLEIEMESKIPSQFRGNYVLSSKLKWNFIPF